MLPLAITLAVLGAISAIFVGIFFLIAPDREVEERLILEQQTYTQEPVNGDRRGLGDRVNSQLKQGQFGAKLGNELNQAGAQITVAEFAGINIALVGASLLLGVLFGRTMVAGLGLAVIAGLLPRLWLKRRKAARRSGFQEQLPDVLNLIVGSLRAGYGLVQAMKLVSQEMPEPSRSEYGRVVNEISLGFTLEQALNHLIERMESDDLMMVVTAINIQNEVGGNLGSVLDTIAETIRSRVKLQGDVRTMTSMQQATGYMLAAMPFFVGAILLFMNPTYIMQMFVFPWFFIPVSAVISMGFGIVLMNKITRIDI